ncbi:hypothetical protein PCANC_17279 [Puccinia coronata f. sp. avenae]|uniref:Uncharacterized protein n=1 Tax=Puccinia coronata f. sp. avenae TaxID=200324 RepID=A0A2N5UIE2_9BASI|nr:hypothetical protein PCANC_17279 [Puccinia coronata f. sp. avenae]
MLSQPQAIQRSTSAPLPMIKQLPKPAPAVTPPKTSVTAPEAPGPAPGASVVTSPKAPSPAPGASVVTAPKAPGPAPVAEQAQREPPHKKPLKSCPSPKVRGSQRVLNQRQHGLGSLMLPKGYLGIQKLAIGGVSKTKHSGH